VSPSSPSPSDEQILRKLTLPVEDRQSLRNPPMWNGSNRWFRSSNVIDVWRHRSSEEKTRRSRP
jgi:hypothetical protein